MKRFAALMAVLALAGCDSFRLFNDYQAVESESVADTPWPRLVDVQDAPQPGVYTTDVPDPAEGVALQSQLSTAGAESEARRARASEPVLSAEDRAALAARANANANRRKALNN